MNAKIKKVIQIAATGLFLIALVINIKVTLDDPFEMVSAQALATGSDSGGGGGSCAQSDPWGPYPNYRTTISRSCIDPEGRMCGIESYCVSQYGETCYPTMCFVFVSN